MSSDKHDDLQLLRRIAEGETSHTAERKQEILCAMRQYHNGGAHTRQMVATLALLEAVVDPDVFNAAKGAAKRIAQEYINDTGQPDEKRR